MSELTLDLSTACLAPLTLPHVAQVAAQAGYHGLELVLGPDYLVRGPAWMRRTVASLALPVVTVHQPLYHLARWSDPATLVNDTVSLAVDLGAEAAVFHSPWAASWAEDKASAWQRALLAARDTAATSNTRLTVENLGDHRGMPPHTVLSNLADLAAFCRQHDLGLTYDTCHAGTLYADLAAELAQVADVLTNVHLSDCRHGLWLGKMPVVDVISANHQLPGDGELDLAGALAALVRQGYRGPVTFEVSPFAARSWRPARRLERLEQALSLARAALSADAMAQDAAPESVVFSSR